MSTLRSLLVLSLAACGGGGSGTPIDARAIDARAIDATPPDATPPDAAPPCPNADVVATSTAAEVTVAGDVGSTAGIFDPSIVYPMGAASGAMSYSSVPDQTTIRTRIATSSDAGATWTFATEANAPEAASLQSTDLGECPTGTCNGNLISEVSSLVYDADDPIARQRWKLFAHRYLVGSDGTLHYRYGTITMQTAGDPAGPWTAPAKLLGWNSPASYSSTGVTLNVSSVSGLSDCLALTEPGAVWMSGRLDLAVGCVYLQVSTPRIRVELLRSTDHGASWSRVRTLVPATMGTCLGGTAGRMNAADLFVAGGVEYVSATPGASDGKYLGCEIWPVDAVRGPPLRSIVASPARFAGACTYAEGATAMGYVLPVGFVDVPPRVFRIFATTVPAP